MGFRDFPYIKGFRVATLMFLVAGLGCAGAHRGPTRQVAVPADPESASASATRPAEPRAALDESDGVFHVVQRGQTLWRISRTYGVDVELLERANALEDGTLLDVGQRLFIPGATRTLVVEAVAPQTPVHVGGNWIWPVPDGRVLSPFGAPRNNRRHAGVDIRGRQGESVLAAQAGQVVYSGSSMRGYGKTIILDHGKGLTTLYAHNSKLLVAEGERVRAGETIAHVGRTGNASTEHCHFEIRRDDRPVDPLIYLVREPEAHP
jgi:murein DD-endopeptidase MepM/ murein hydrolase activator NlpD